MALRYHSGYLIFHSVEHSPPAEASGRCPRSRDQGSAVSKASMETGFSSCASSKFRTRVKRLLPLHRLTPCLSIVRHEVHGMRSLCSGRMEPGETPITKICPPTLVICRHERHTIVAG